MDQPHGWKLLLPGSSMRTENHEIPPDDATGVSRLISVARFWEDVKPKKKKGFPWIRIYDNAKTPKKLNLGPGGAIGLGCGAGIGVAIVGGAGGGASLWNYLRLVFGVGFGCGAGIGYGFGYGIGVFWDRPPEKIKTEKRVVIEI